MNSRVTWRLTVIWGQIRIQLNLSLHLQSYWVLYFEKLVIVEGHLLRLIPHTRGLPRFAEVWFESARLYLFLTLNHLQKLDFMIPLTLLFIQVLNSFVFSFI